MLKSIQEDDLAQSGKSLSSLMQTVAMRLKGRWLYYLVAGAALLFTTIAVPGFYYLRDAPQNLIDGNYRTAFRQYLPLAKANDPVAQNVVGNLLFLGLGVSQNRREAASWYLKAGLSGYAPAQINLGQMYLNGIGLRVNKLKAAGWFRLAKLGGSERADKHIRYMISANDILSPMLGQSKLEFRDLETVRRSVKAIGEMEFLSRSEWVR